MTRRASLLIFCSYCKDATVCFISRRLHHVPCWCLTCLFTRVSSDSLPQDVYVSRLHPYHFLYFHLTEKIERTVQIEASTVEIEERGVKLRLTVVDTPGYGDAINSQDWCVSELLHTLILLLLCSLKICLRLPISDLSSHWIQHV